MWELRACVVCLSTAHKLYNLDERGLREDYNVVAGLNSYRGNGLPSYMCFECAAYVRRYKYFQGKCQRANFVLQEILKQNKVINKSALVALKKESLGIMPSLTFWNLNKCHYEQQKFQWVKHNRISLVEASNAPIFFMSTMDNMHYTLKEEATIKKEAYVTIEVPSISSKDSKSELPVQIPSISSKDTKPELPWKIPIIPSKATKSELPWKIPRISSKATKSELPLQIPSISSKDTKLEFPMQIQEVNGTIIENERSDINCDNDSGENTADDFEVLDNVEDDADGSRLDEEYANIIALNENEQKAASEILKLFSHGKQKCEVCQKGFQNEERLKIHMRMHDKHVSGLFFCELCSFYYKTEFLLKSHITEKHMYKYLCPRCPEINFDRPSAKQHYIWVHLKKGVKKGTNWYQTRPAWMNTRGGRRIKSQKADEEEVLLKSKKKKKKPKDFPIYSPIGHLEQYEIINERQFTKNFIESEYKCGWCFRGFRACETYTNHLKKHDPAFSGEYQCDICNLHFLNTRKLYKHMISAHVYKYTCQTCSYMCYNLGQARAHYRWHKNVTYACPHCPKVFTKLSTRLTHIRIKHPSSELCNICGHSFVSIAGLYFHKRKVHTKEELDLSQKLVEEPQNYDQDLFCTECKIQFLSQTAFEVHFGSSNKHATENISVKPKSVAEIARMRKREVVVKRPKRATEVHNNGLATSTVCEECGKVLPNDVQARKHYKDDHPGVEFIKRYMCDICGHVTQQYSNLMVHMRTHTREKPYACNFCDRRFSMPSNRDRHLVVHTGEKRFQCEHCHRKFTQSSAVKLHIQTVHFKIPYAPWVKANRKRNPRGKDIIGQTDPKIVAETQGEYLNAYISYHDEGV